MTAFAVPCRPLPTPMLAYLVHILLRMISERCMAFWCFHMNWSGGFENAPFGPLLRSWFVFFYYYWFLFVRLVGEISLFTGRRCSWLVEYKIMSVLAESLTLTRTNFLSLWQYGSLKHTGYTVCVSIQRYICGWTVSCKFCVCILHTLLYFAVTK